ncbi:MAG: elongation factor P [Acidobacteriota bacterium]|nr:elongation factor P [Acidobacteriota bacterium]
MKATNIRKGNILRIDDVLWKVLVMDHVTPGKGPAHVQTKLRNLMDGTQTEKRFRSTDDVDRVALETKEMQYLYSDPQGYHFMDTESYEQTVLSEDVVGDVIKYILPDTVIKMEWFESTPVGIDLPAAVDLKVTETMPGIKDATASAQRKPATVETGFVVQVPSFINEGEVIRVSTVDGSYLGRGESA